MGNDIYPAFRLIIPDKDRERPMYGLKESIIGKILVNIMKINKDSEDGIALRDWKLPGKTASSRMAGDFAGRCYEIISKRPMRTEPGDMGIDEVNDLLNQLAAANKQVAQEDIFARFYSRMNAEELMWLIRIVLRQMKVGASEKTIFTIWHPDADSLFNICSNLRRVCWELWDPKVRLDSEERGVALMQCFQPQLAQFQMSSFKKMVEKMQPTEEDPVFWIEEKLDGERMQLHMVSDEQTPGGKRFAFWSRKAKEYTHLYGNGYEDEQSSLTRFIKNSFDERVDNIILDGEMITWDPTEDAMVPFGSLKTAAKIQQDNPFSKEGWRPLYRVFDILLLNDQDLTVWTLRDRRRALDEVVNNVPMRLEVHEYFVAREISEIDPILRKVVADASEGLVLKNPRSAYRLNQRNDDWIKVKPEYMNEYGESLECLVIGGYYGSGKRGGRLSSFLCGLRVDDKDASRGTKQQMFYSFFKVGGGFSGADYATMRHRTEGKWKKWDPKRPPNDYIALATDGRKFLEQPDEWILPSDSVVLEVKAASVAGTEQFKMGITLRFPRMKKIREDRNWENALSIPEFMKLKSEAEGQKKDKEFQVDQARRKKPRISKKKPLRLLGGEGLDRLFPMRETTKLFEGLKFFVMTGSPKPEKKTKEELEDMVKSHGGQISQTYSDGDGQTICIGHHRSVKVSSAIKRGDTDIIQPGWLFDNIKQAQVDGDRPRFLLPFEPRHIFSGREECEDMAKHNVDDFNDSYARGGTVEELSKILNTMSAPTPNKEGVEKMRADLQGESEAGELPGWLFDRTSMFFDTGRSSGAGSIASTSDTTFARARRIARFAGAHVEEELREGITHVVTRGEDKDRVREIRRQSSAFQGGLPRIVKPEWVEQSWREGTLLDEEGDYCLAFHFNLGGPDQAIWRFHLDTAGY